MRLVLITVGERVPPWVAQGFDDYARRMPRECALELVELPAARHGRGAAVDRAIAEEGQRLLDACPKRCRRIVLDERGQLWRTADLAARLEDWLQGGTDVALLVGGADGLSAEVKASADATWSLSPLTLPHALVRVLVAEQLYRAWTILQRHPYHRE